MMAARLEKKRGLLGAKLQGVEADQLVNELSHYHASHIGADGDQRRKPPAYHSKAVKSLPEIASLLTAFLQSHLATSVWEVGRNFNANNCMPDCHPTISYKTDK